MYLHILLKKNPKIVGHWLLENFWTIFFCLKNVKKFKELCIYFYIDFVGYFYDLLKTSEKELKKHLFFLFKVYYSPMVDYCTEREKKNEELKLIIIIII